MDFNYTIIRSLKRRKLSIIVERDRRIVIHAPMTTTEEKIREIVESKRQWIYEKVNHSQKYSDIPHPPGKEMVNGESAMYMGRNYRIEIVDTPSGKIEFAQRFYIPVSEDSEGFVAWYIAQAKEKIIPRVRHYAHQLGVEYDSVKIVDNKYRWGSCTVNNNLCFNWRLIKAPMSVIDYVVVHELAHLIEANHTPRFWNIVKAQVSTSQKSKNWLKEFGSILEQSL